MTGAQMRAVVQDRYGPPEVLRVDTVPIPRPGPDEVLVEVAATSINLTDWEGLTGSPLYARIGGLRRPRRPILGSDIAGRVVELGSDVSSVAVGDDVYGDNLFPKGGFAEYAAIPVGALAHKPPELSFVEASTIPQSGAIALQGTAGVVAGSRVLVNGAGGGSGPFAIQLAKRSGATVTAVDNRTKLAFVASVGADDVIDYQVTDFTETGWTWDLVLDLVATRSALACRRALARGGRYRAVGGAVPVLLGLATAGTVVGRISGRRIGILGVREGPDHFGPLASLVAAGEVEVHIDRTFTLDAVPEALALVGEGRSRGKVVIEVG